ncbi:MAG: SPFH domain-containing protein [Candidatus Coproplasma sp.]
MTIGIILGIVFFVAAVGTAIASAYFFKGGFNVTFGSKNARFTHATAKSKVRGGIFGGIAAVFALLFVFIPFSFHTVVAGEVAVVKHLGNATAVRTAGTYFDFWVTESYDMYDARVQNLDIRTTAYSKDAQTMDIAMTVQYQIDASKAIEIANNYGSLDVLSNRIQSVTIEKTKSVLSSYSAMTIIETRASISPQVEATVKSAIDGNYHVTVNTVVLTNIDFSDAFEKTVEDKMIAEQEKLKAEYEKETAIVNAEKQLEVAKLEAEARIASAEGEAQAQILAARAEAQAIKEKSLEVARMLGFTISERAITDADGATGVEYYIDFGGKDAQEIAVISDYLKYVEYLAKWNGELPGVLVSDGSAQVIIPTS